MNSADIVMAIIVLGSGVMAFFRGLTREILGLVSWLAAIIVAYFSIDQVGHYARSHIANPLMADLLTGAAVFFVFLILFTVVSHTVSRHIQDSALGGVDRSLGLAYGLVRGGLALLVIDMLVSFIIAREDYPDFISKSRFSPVVSQYSKALEKALPDKVSTFLKGLVPEKSKTPSKEGNKGSSETVLPDDVDAMVDSLAQMKPHQDTSNQDTQYNKAHLQDMERLFQTADEDN